LSLAPASLLPSLPLLASAPCALVPVLRAPYALSFSPNFFRSWVLPFDFRFVPFVSLASFALSPDRSAIAIRHMRLPTAYC
jgi:hypothetical protein